MVGRWAAQQEKELKLLTRSDGSRLFSNLTRGNHYLVQAEGYLNNSGSGQTSEMALTWNRTLSDGSVSNGTVDPAISISFSQVLWKEKLRPDTLSSCPTLGDLLPLPGAVPLRLLLGLHVLPGLPLGPVVRLVPVSVPLPAARQPRAGALPRGRAGRRQGRG